MHVVCAPRVDIIYFFGAYTACAFSLVLLASVGLQAALEEIYIKQTRRRLSISVPRDKYFSCCMRRVYTNFDKAHKPVSVSCTSELIAYLEINNVA